MLKSSTSIFLFCLFGLWACQSPGPISPDRPSGYNPNLVNLDLPGENSRARFSPDGASIVFVSQNRLHHSHKQAYLYSLIEKTEKRITHQDGEVTEVIFITQHSKQKAATIAYASTTDEIKENPYLIQNYLNLNRNVQNEDKIEKNLLGEQLSKTEVYTSTIWGRDIERLTLNPGFDGQINLRKDGISFYSYKNSQRIYQSLALSGTSKKINFIPHNVDFLAWSKDSSLVSWTQLSKSNTNDSDLWIHDTKKNTLLLVASSPGHHVDSVWHPNNEAIVFSSNRNNSKDYQLFMVKSDGTCFTQLTYDSGSKRHPDLSPDGNKIVFTHLVSGKSQLATMDFLPPSCSNDARSIQ